MNVKRYNRYWYKLSIKRKMFVFFFIISLVGIVINLSLHNNNYRIMDQFNVNLTNYYMINELSAVTSENRSHAESYLRGREEEEKSKYLQTKEEMNRLITELEERFFSMEAIFSIRAIKYSIEAYSAKWEKAMEEREKGEAKYYIELYDGMRIYGYTEQYIQELLYHGLDEGAQLYSDLVQDFQFIKAFSLGIILSTFAFSLLFGELFADHLVAPMKKLVQSSIQIAKGQLDVDHVEVKSEDEVGILADSFNHMSKSIRHLVSDLKQKALIEKKLHEEEIELIRMQQLLQEAEFLALQSQINPHFLFNTLNTISRTAMFENAQDTVKLISALSSILRFSLRNTEKHISLQEELDMVKEYIYLQKFRFRDRLHFEIKQEDVDLKKICLPIFSIQPLVENAIIHGIEPKVEGGTVEIHIYPREDGTHIDVVDTGVGMPQERLKALLEDQSGKKTKSIGIRNVFNRFQIFFGMRGQFTVTSELGAGTQISMVLPNETGGEYYV